MLLPKYKFFIRNRQQQYYFVDETKSVQLLSSPTELVKAPKEWQEITIGIYANEKYKGSYAVASTPQQFVTDGKAIIDYLAIYNGKSAWAEFIIEIRDDVAYNYSTLFSGTLDFSEWQQGEFESTINIRETRLLDILESKENLVVEIPLTNDNSVELEHDGILLTYKSLFAIDNGFSVDPNAINGRHVVGLTLASNENPYARATLRTQYQLFNADLYNTAPYFYEAVVEASIVVNYNFRVLARFIPLTPAPNPTAALRYNIVVIQASGNVLSLPSVIYQQDGIDDVFSSQYNVGRWHNIQGSISINVVAGDRVFFINSYSPDGDLAEFTYDVTPAEFIVTSTQRNAATRHRAMRPSVLWNEIITRVTNGQYVAQSSLLAADNRQLILSGQSLRGEENPKIQTTVKDFLQYAYSQFTAILSDTRTAAVLEAYGTKYSEQIGVDLGVVKNLQVSFSKSKNITQIKTGYTNLDLGIFQVNGKDEWNQTNYFSTGMIGADNEDSGNKGVYDIICPYIGSIYAIEDLRINFSKKDTTDNTNDNKTFVIDCGYETATNRWKIRRSTFVTASNCLQPTTAYNTEITPKDLLLKHGRIICGGIYPLSLSTIKFESGDKNVLFTKTYSNGKVVRENDNVDISEFDNPYIFPLEITFESDYPSDLFTRLQSGDKYRQVQFKWFGHTQFGYIEQVEVVPDNLQSVNFKLILSARADIVKLLNRWDT